MSSVSRVCGMCGSDRLAIVAKAADHWRKECLSCGSTGPFIPAGADPSAQPWLAQFSTDQLETRVEEWVANG